MRIFYKQHPIANPDEVVVNFGEPTEFNVLLNDDIPPGTTVTLLDVPSQGTITDNEEEGFFTYCSYCSLFATAK